MVWGEPGSPSYLPGTADRGSRTAGVGSSVWPLSDGPLPPGPQGLTAALPLPLAR